MTIKGKGMTIKGKGMSIKGKVMTNTNTYFFVISVLCCWCRHQGDAGQDNGRQLHRVLPL